MAASNRDKAGKPLSNFRLEQIYSAGDYLSEPSDPQTYGSCTNIEAMRLVNMVRARDRQIEVYRKALEPVAKAFAQRGLLFGEVPVDQDWKEAVAEACRLMDIPLHSEKG